MHVLLLATNEQPKLSVLAKTTPAPLLPIVNRPVMALTVEILARAGYKDLLVSLCNQSGSIAAYFGTGSRWGVRIEYLIQRESWGSAGALGWAANILTDTALILPGDSIIDLDIDAALAFHRAHGGPVTLIGHHSPQQPAAQPIALDAEGRLCDRDAAGFSHLLEFTGAYIVEPSVLPLIPAQTPFDSYDQLVPAMQNAGFVIHGYRMAGYWNNLDSVQAYQEAQKVFLYSAYAASDTLAEQSTADIPRVRYPSIEGQQIAPGIWVGQNHIIHPSARLAPPLCIGEGCRIGYGAELGPEVVLGRSVVIDQEATVSQSIVLDRTYVGQLVNIHHRVINKTMLIDAETSDSIRVVDPFLLAETRLPNPRGQLQRLLSCVIAGVLLAVTLPLTLVIALCVALSSGGQLFARSPRLGRATGAKHGLPNAPESFDLLAFQIRRPNGTCSIVGRWLYYLEWDRFPELWNVLKGDLALVGVKPLLPADAASLDAAWRQRRNEYSPGLTGLWYTQTYAESDLDDILVADAYYVATRTWRGDMLLALQTPAAWLRRLRHAPRQVRTQVDFSEQMDRISSH